MLDKLLLGLKVAAIGLVLVFVILYLLILAVRLLHVIVGRQKNKSEKKEVVEPEVAYVEEEVEDDGALVAAISAAVYACLASEGDRKDGGHPEFVIRKIREIRR